MLAGQPVPPTVMGEQGASPGLRQLIDALDLEPAYVMGRYWDLHAWNTIADCVFDFSAAPSPRARNIVWRLFTDPARRSFYSDWEGIARKVLAEFRADSARYPGDPAFAALIDDLQRASPEFRVWWPRHDVRDPLDGRKEIEHPRVGRLTLEHTTLQVATAPDLKVMIYTPLEEADTRVKLQRLRHMGAGGGATAVTTALC